MKPDTLFGTWPYVAFGILTAGILIRYLFSRGRMESIARDLSKTWEVYGGGPLWRVGVLCVLAGHFAGLVFPAQIVNWNRSAGRLYLLEGTAFLLGLMALAGWAGVVWKHLGRSAGSFISEVADTILLALLLVGMATGLLAAVLYRWGSSWGVATLTPYIITVLRGKPVLAFATPMPFLVQLHVVSSFAALAVLPFTRLAPVLLVVLHRCLSVLGKPVVAVFEGAEAWLRRRNLAALIWPEED